MKLVEAIRYKKLLAILKPYGVPFASTLQLQNIVFVIGFTNNCRMTCMHGD